MSRGRGVRVFELALAGRVLVVALAAPGLARLSLVRLQRVLEPRRAPAQPAPGTTVDGVARIVSGVMRRGRPLVRPGCMPRGLTRYYALRRAGFDVALCFGIGRPPGGGPADELSGHCWIVCDGEALFEPVGELTSFHEIARLSAAGVEGTGRMPSMAD